MSGRIKSADTLIWLSRPARNLALFGYLAFVRFVRRRRSSMIVSASRSSAPSGGRLGRRTTTSNTFVLGESGPALSKCCWRWPRLGVLCSCVVLLAVVMHCSSGRPLPARPFRCAPSYFGPCTLVGHVCEAPPSCGTGGGRRLYIGAGIAWAARVASTMRDHDAGLTLCRHARDRRRCLRRDLYLVVGQAPTKFCACRRTPHEFETFILSFGKGFKNSVLKSESDRLENTRLPPCQEPRDMFSFSAAILAQLGPP